MHKKLLPQTTELSKLSMQEFEQLKFIRSTTNLRIARQEDLMSKIQRGKWKQKEITNEKLYALARHDLKILEKYRVDIEERLPILREKVHVNLISDYRSVTVQFEKSPEKKEGLSN